jgi:2,3-bisphosphoglycerate-dependent phosphoglycerate mutase
MDAEGARQVPYAMPPRASELILVRHGATEEARAEAPFPLVEGRGDPRLTAAGVEQAAAVAGRLRRERIAAIYVTPLRRTAETAAPLAAHTSLRPTVLPELTEVHLGRLEGGAYRVRAAAGDPLVRQVFVEGRWDVIPGAESNEEIAGRARVGIDRIVHSVGPGAAAAVFTHGAMIGELCRQATGAETMAMVNADNCSISRIVAFPSGRLLLRSFGDIGHLA